MKTFKDIEFKSNPMGEDFGIVSRTKFDNGYEVSVVKSQYTYGFFNKLESNRNNR